MAGVILARWLDWVGRGVEHLTLREDGDGVVVDSVVVGFDEETPFAARYRLGCDAAWRVRRVAIELIGEARSLTLECDGQGHWRDGPGRALPELSGAMDVDIAITPFTNTLPIRRLNLARGQSVDLKVAYVRVPALTVAPDPQRYTCLEPMKLYRYDSLDSDFTRDIEVDDKGLVVTYPGLFRRVI